LAATFGILALVMGGGGLVAAAPAGADTTWPMYHANPARTGFDPSEPSLDPATKAWTASLGAAVYGQPVVADGRIFAATEGNRVVALDPHSGAVLWSQSLGTPLTNVAQVAGCGDIDPLGVTSTPVVDAATNTVYVVGEISTGGSSVHHELEGFNAYTGALVVQDDVDPPLPSGESAVNLLQRTSLALGNGRVYVGYGGNDGDCGVYHGWLVGVNESGPADMVSFEAAPNGQGGAIWEPGGPSIDSSGDVYVTTGNPNNPDDPPKIDTESVVKLSPTLTVLDSFQDASATGDADLSTDSPTLVGDGHVFAVGKTDIGYVLNTSNLSEVTHIPGLCEGDNPDGGNAYDAATNTIYIPCRNAGIQAVDLTTDTAGPVLAGENSGPILIGNDLWASGYPGGTLTEWNVAPGANNAVIQTLNAGTVPTFASPSAALGLVLIGTTTGVTAFDGPTGLPPTAPPPPPGGTVPPPGAASCQAAAPASSYLLTASDGGIFNYGGAPFCGSIGGQPLDAPVVASAADPNGGYWSAASDGGVFSFDAPFEGSAGGLALKAPVVGMAAAPSGGGYWLVASDGGIFNYGDAPFEGSLGSLHLNAPIVGMAPTPDGRGYWLVASDGGIFAFGDATFHGSLGGLALNAPIVGITPTADGGGYTLAASDGGVFTFGDATFHGSLGGLALNAPIVGIAASPGGAGYWLAASDGGVFAFGGAPFGGSLGGTALVRPVVGITAG
jgi:polyvinyl alcohol dehydrogenase (cytochrome)